MSEINLKVNLPYSIKNTLIFRKLSVKTKQLIDNFYYRIVLTGEQLKGFDSQGFDDHVKVFFPEDPAVFVPPQISPEGIIWNNNKRPPSRDYTPLSWDTENNELTLDFYIHEQGLATEWAKNANPGDPLTIAGPRGSIITPQNYSYQLYICDESSLPAVYRRLKTLRQSVKVWIKSQYEEILNYLSDFDAVEISRLNSDDIALALARENIPPQDYFIWIAGEGNEVKTLKEILMGRHGLNMDYVRAKAYWHKK